MPTTVTKTVTKSSKKRRGGRPTKRGMKKRTMYKKSTQVRIGNQPYGQVLQSPFPKVLPTKINYRSEYGSFLTTAIGALAYTRWKPNDLYDLDFDGNLRNYVPQAYNQLLSISGPYRRYMVYAWKATISVMNFTDAPCDVFFDPGTAFASGEADSVTEVVNRQGVQLKTLTGQNNKTPNCTFTTYRTLKSFLGQKPSEILSNWGGLYNSSPGAFIYSTLLCRSIDGTTSPQVRARIRFTYYVKLFDFDNQLS